MKINENGPGMIYLKTFLGANLDFFKIKIQSNGILQAKIYS